MENTTDNSDMRARQTLRDAFTNSSGDRPAREMSTLEHFRANAQSHTIRLADIADRLEEFGNRAYGCQPIGGEKVDRAGNQVEAVPDAQVEQVFQILNAIAFQISRIEDAFSRIQGLV